MSTGLSIGTKLAVPDLPGTWSIWSPADAGPGAYFAIPVGDDARAAGVKYAVIRAVQKATEARPTITLLRTESA